MKQIAWQLSCLMALMATSLVAQSCGGDDEVQKNFEDLTWGAWRLQEIVTADQIRTPSSALGYEQYLENKYHGWTVTGPQSREEIDSVIVYRDRKPILRSRIVEKLSKDVDQQKFTAKLNNGKYFSRQFIGVDGPDDGTGNDQLLVSELVDSPQALEKATLYRYVRANGGKRPW